MNYIFRMMVISAAWEIDMRVPVMLLPENVWRQKMADISTWTKNLKGIRYIMGDNYGYLRK